MPAIDDFGPQAMHPHNAGRHAFDVVPDDATDLEHVTRFLNVAAAGTVRCILADDDATVDLNLAVGVLHSIAVKRVYATGTTATGIKAIY